MKVPVKITEFAIDNFNTLSPDEQIKENMKH